MAVAGAHGHDTMNHGADSLLASLRRQAEQMP
jgi:hypothetical protein